MFLNATEPYFLKAIIDFNLDSMLASASGSTFPNISKEQLHNLEIDLPPLPEQQAIASVLSALDDKIDLLGNPPIFNGPNQ